MSKNEDLHVTSFRLTRRLNIFILLLFLLLRSYLTKSDFRTVRDLWHEILVYIFCTPDEYYNAKREVDRILIALNIKSKRRHKPVISTPHGMVYGPIVVDKFDAIRKIMVPLSYENFNMTPVPFISRRIHLSWQVQGFVTVEHDAQNEKLITWLKQNGDVKIKNYFRWFFLSILISIITFSYFRYKWHCYFYFARANKRKHGGHF